MDILKEPETVWLFVVIIFTCFSDEQLLRELMFKLRLTDVVISGILDWWCGSTEGHFGPRNVMAN